MQGATVVLLREGHNRHSGFGGAHLSNQDFSRVGLVHPKEQLVADRVSLFNQTVGECRGVAIELLQSPVEVLLVESDGIEHVVGGHRHLVLTSNRVCWELRVHYLVTQEEALTFAAEASLSNLSEAHHLYCKWFIIS